MVRNGEREKESRKHEKQRASLEDKKDAKEKTLDSRSKKLESKSKRGQGPCAAEAEEVQGGGTACYASKSRSPIQNLQKSEENDVKPVLSETVVLKPVASDSAHSDSESSGERRRKRRENAGLKAASGFGLAPREPQC